MCAILYDNSHYNTQLDGWVYKVSETDSENIIANYNNDASSLKVRNGCTFKAYKKINQDELMFNATDDMEDLGSSNQQISSYSCECEPSKTIFQLHKYFDFNKLSII